MLFVDCPFCHKRILRFLYASHRLSHTKRLADGQMTDHITVHPTGRYQGSLKGIPRSYRHSACGGGTVMPEEIVRSYLVNPFLYSDRSFCCGCNDYRPQKELFWIETGQSLDEYFRQLKTEYIKVYGCPPPNRPV